MNIDKRRKERTFKKGDIVYVTITNKLDRNKLEQVRSGPFLIIRRISNSMYELNTNKRRKEASKSNQMAYILFPYYRGILL